ncbi:hypothetical protein V6Z11_A07G064100 [Gossypium hirsutum]
MTLISYPPMERTSREEGQSRRVCNKVSFMASHLGHFFIKTDSDKRNFNVSRKNLVTNSPSKNPNFRKGINLPNSFLIESMQTETYLLKQKPRISRLRREIAMGIVEPNHSLSGPHYQ